MPVRSVTCLAKTRIAITASVNNIYVELSEVSVVLRSPFTDANHVTTQVNAVDNVLNRKLSGRVIFQLRVDVPVFKHRPETNVCGHLNPDHIITNLRNVAFDLAKVPILTLDERL